MGAQPVGFLKNARDLFCVPGAAGCITEMLSPMTASQGVAVLGGNSCGDWFVDSWPRPPIHLPGEPPALAGGGWTLDRPPR